MIFKIIDVFSRKPFDCLILQTKKYNKCDLGGDVKW